MNPFAQLICYFKNSVFGSSLNPKTINKTGIVCSDYPVVGNGWIKGWVVNVESKNIVIVAAHSNPSITSPNNRVFVKNKFGEKIYRSIVEINSRPYCLNGKSVDKLNGGDICICRVDSPFPDEIVGYDFAKVKESDMYSPVFLFDQKDNINRASLSFKNGLAWIVGENRDRLLTAGDSGTPWFFYSDGQWAVATHTTKGFWGEGPWYYHPNLFKEIKRRISALRGFYD